MSTVSWGGRFSREQTVVCHWVREGAHCCKTFAVVGRRSCRLLLGLRGQRQELRTLMLVQFSLLLASWVPAVCHYGSWHTEIPTRDSFHAKSFEFCWIIFFFQAVQGNRIWRKICVFSVPFLDPAHTYISSSEPADKAPCIIYKKVLIKFFTHLL